MAETNSITLTLLRAGLYDDPAIVASLPPLTDSQWEEIYNQSKRQTVSGIILHALSFLPDEALPPYNLLLRWVARGHRIEMAHERMNRTIATLFTTFDNAGLHPILQKGHDVSRFYPRPSLRVCGDIDIFFPDNERPQADHIIRSKGVNVVHTPDNSSGYIFDGIEVEHHSKLVELHNPLCQATLNAIINREGSTRATVGTVFGHPTEVPVPAPLVDLIMINVHIMKHCLGVGIGLRHFCDYAMAWEALVGGSTPLVDCGQYIEACRSLGILGWTRILHAFILTYIPGSSASLPSLYPDGKSPGKVLSKIFRMVMEGGNFGLFRENRAKMLNETPWRRKASTVSSILSHSALSAHLAPAEAFWTFLHLMGGQLR